MGILVISTAVTYRVGRLALDTQARMAAQLMVLKQLPTLIAMVSDAETGQRGYLLTDDPAYLEPYNQTVNQLDSQLSSISVLATNGDISSGQLRELIDRIRLKMSELTETIEVRRQKGPLEALAIVRSNRGKLVMDEIRRRADDLRAKAQRDYDAASHTFVRATNFRTFTFIGSALLNIGFLAWAYRRIARQDWLRAGQMRLNEALAGEKNLSEIADGAMKLLADYLGAQAGALFVENAGAFQRVATYAVPAAAGIPERFERGDGLLGQAAKDGRVFLVKDVPEGYLKFGSSLGQAAPRHLLIAPMKADREVNAVLELGFLAPPPQASADLMARVSDAIALAVRSAKYRTKLQELLEETQRQSEELQTQSEELRVSNEELVEQSRALKESQARLEQQQVELEQTNSQLEEQTQILERQRDDLREAKTELENQARVVEQASRYKSDFLANMSHELRTPLNSSLILAKLLADNKAKNLTDEQVKYARTIESAGNDLLALINDVLDLSKIEAGHLEMRPQTIPIARIVENLKSIFEPIAAQKRLNLQFTVTTETPAYIHTDLQRLEQVLKNLLSNALKFTERGEVALEVRGSGGQIHFNVRDSGIGIAERDQAIIFEPFCQADGAMNRKYGGTGLGLSISRELARMLGGEIQVRSQVGIGSVFTVIIPTELDLEKAPPSVREPRPIDGPLAAGGRKPSESPIREARTVPRKSRIADDREKLSGDSRIILIVEDDESFATLLCDLAHESTFQCLIATSAEEALALAQQYVPAAILLDIGLPDNSGMYVLERLKNDSRTRHIPVHVVSGSDYAQTALSMGAVGYMLKPVRREQLVDAFQKLEVRLTQKLRRVLVVEDDAVQLESLRRLLGSGEVQTKGAQTAAACLEELKNTTFDCMVLDLSLPDSSGFALLETLSEKDTYSFPPVIIYTGRDLTMEEEQKLRKYSKSIIIKGAKSPERLLDEVTLFLHQVVSDLPAEQQKMLEQARSRDAALEGRKILIVEDDIRNVFALTSLLETHGVILQITRNGLEALSALNNAKTGAAPPPDLVLMDIMMPEMDGLTAMREIRKDPAWKKLPIIALTAKAMKNDQRECLDAGANDYLAKPLEVDKLLSLIRVWMPR